MERYIIVERYADNGELSHRALVDSADGRELGTDGGEPEDQSFWRDLAWVPDELNKAQAQIEALQAVIDDHHRLVRELDVSINGVEGAAKQASLCDLVSQIQALQRERDEAIRIACGRSAALDAARSLSAAWAEKACQYEVELNGDPQNFYGYGRITGLRDQLAQLQALVREIKEEFDNCTHECERCGESDPLTTFDIYRTVVKAATLAALTPANGGQDE